MLVPHLWTLGGCDRSHDAWGPVHAGDRPDLAASSLHAHDGRGLSQDVRLRRSLCLTANSAALAAPIDTTYRLETPEGIDLRLVPAGPVVRGLALAIDVMIRQTVAAVVGIALGRLGGAGVGAYLIVAFLMEWFYPVFFEVLENGQTPGKRMLSLRVVNKDGTPVAWSESILRNLLRFADLLPSFYLLGIVSMLCTQHFQRIGDLAAGTLVVHVVRARQVVAPVVVEGTRAVPITLEPDEQRAILNFAERSGELSAARTVELAEILEPLTGATGAGAATETLRIANGLAGRS
ncbi:MAG: RDD family protein [bacterium]|nr:RDD family protein [bacterium]